MNQRILSKERLRLRRIFSLGLACLLLGQAEAIVRYDLYRGSNQYVPKPLIAPYYDNGQSDFNTNYVLYTNNLIDITKMPGAVAASGTSAQANYERTDYIMCDISAYNSGVVAAAPSCNNRIAGYEGYTAILLPKAGSYSFKVTGNDSMQIDVINPLAQSQATATNLDYKNMTYTTTTGPLRSGGNGAFWTVSVNAPTYVMFRMYWDNWGNDADYHLLWTTPDSNSFVNVPSTYTCDPQAPAKDCFPDISLAKTAPAYVKPSVAASTNPPVAAQANYLSPYTLTVGVTASPTGNTATFGTTTIKDTLPNSLTWLPGTSGYTAPAGWTCTVSGQDVTCSSSNALVAGTSYKIQLNNLLVATDTAAGTQISNSATVVNANESTVNLTNNTDTAVTRTVLTKLTKSVVNLSTGETSGAMAYPGNKLHYCITAENNGGADLDNYTITDYIAPNLNGIGSIVLYVDGSQISGSTYDPSVISNPNDGTVTNGLVTSAGFTLKSLKTAQLCFDASID